MGKVTFEGALQADLGAHQAAYPKLGLPLGGPLVGLPCTRHGFQVRFVILCKDSHVSRNWRSCSTFTSVEFQLVLELL